MDKKRKKIYLILLLIIIICGIISIWVFRNDNYQIQNDNLIYSNYDLWKKACIKSNGVVSIETQGDMLPVGFLCITDLGKKLKIDDLDIIMNKISTSDFEDFFHKYQKH